jgi:hypothetical protein
MVFTFLPYSIANDSSNPKDYDSPYSFLAFIQYRNLSNIDANEELKSYQKYVNTWASKKNLKKSDENAIVRDAYVNLMREITLNFSTEEEKRFILNADFEDDSDLDMHDQVDAQHVEATNAMNENEANNPPAQSIAPQNPQGPMA